MIPSFVSLQERAALRDFVALNWTGGPIVEIGAFAGASAVAINQGMDAARLTGVFHVYDTFMFPDGEAHAEAYRQRLPWNHSDSFLSNFQLAVAPWVYRMHVHIGDALRSALPPDSIYLLHLDCAISAAFHRAVSQRFFPLVTPGGVIVQQDEGYDQAIWIAPAMKRLVDAGRVVRLFRVETSIYYAVRQGISAEDVDAAFGGLV